MIKCLEVDIYICALVIFGFDKISPLFVVRILFNAYEKMHIFI